MNAHFKTGDYDLIYIEKTSKTNVLEATSDRKIRKVIEEVYVEGKAEQTWKKGKPNVKATLLLRAILKWQRLLLLFLKVSWKSKVK